MIDDTATLLAVRVSASGEGPQAALNDLSQTVITWISLQTRANVYRYRVDRALVTAANRGAEIDEIAGAAGIAVAEVVQRLAANADRLLPEVQDRLALATASHQSTEPAARKPGLWSLFRRRFR